MAGKTPAHFVLIAGPAVDSPAAGRKTPAQDEHKALADALAAYETAEADAALQDAAA
ncbi:hypothetical protein D3C71_2144380 [compost metagenome]